LNVTVRQLRWLLEFDRECTSRIEVYYDCLRLGVINYTLIVWSGSRDPFNFEGPMIFEMETIAISDLMCRLMMGKYDRLPTNRIT